MSDDTPLAVRIAVRRLGKILPSLPPSEPLGTSQMISLYLWLIDSESLSTDPLVEALVDLVLGCLEAQRIDAQRLYRLHVLCRQAAGSLRQPLIAARKQVRRADFPAPDHRQSNRGSQKVPAEFAPRYRIKKTDPVYPGKSKGAKTET